ncbi:MAG: argininosuccinate lyase [Flavobacteriaceae bacterium]|nr:argininosuccinate lyase [Flavobacteriaceae bacterium]MBL6684382.1 argininosuccinate lyase [Flavobacteriaceae bacterium]
MKLWTKNDELDKIIEKFTVGKDRYYDMFLAKYDIIASIAHAKMLQKINLISSKEMNLLVKELNKIKKLIYEDKFIIDEKFEDIHSKIESYLTENLGDLGKKIHTGRSRNDQVLVSLQLLFKDEILNIKLEINKLFKSLIKLSKKNKDYLLPGYTHLQTAMPSSFGLWFSSYAESLIDDVLFLNTAYKINDQNPLGSAAGYGTSFEIDREFTTKELGFKELKYNVLASQMNRGKIEKSLSIALSSIATTLSTFCSDICFYMTQELNFISFPNEMTTGSSIMPHKKNPDVFELIRAKCNSIKALPNELILMSNNLTSGYHRDYQIFKGRIIDAILDAIECIKVFNYSINKIKVRKNILDDDKYKFIFSVENLNELVKNGKTFRDSYNQISKEIKNNTFKPNKTIKHTLIGGIHNLSLDQIELKMKENFK